MSAPVAPRRSAGGPRQPAGPRAGAGRRGPGGPRRPLHVGAPALAARELEQPGIADERPDLLAAAAQPEPVALPPAPPPGSGDGLSGLRLLLDQLDALLRDPTLALALKAFGAKLAGGLRALAAGTARAIRRLGRLRLRLPRRALLALLALTLPLALIALLSSGHDDRATSPGAAPQPVAAGAGPSLPGVAMPALRTADTRPKAVRVALVLDRSYDPPALRRELSALGAWLTAHHAAGTRVTLIDAGSARASAPLRAADLAGGRALRTRASTMSAIRAALGHPRGRRLLVTVGSTAPALGGASTLSIATRPGARPSIPSRRGRRSRAVIDDRRPNTLAASVARAIMAVSGQRERR